MNPNSEQDMTQQPTSNPGTASPAEMGLPVFSETEMEPVRQADGRLTNYPPVEKWDDWVEWDAKSWPDKVARRYSLVPTVCFNCESACGLLAYVDKETFEIKKFEGNPAHPGSRGRNCAKGPATHNQTYDPERILYPLKRVGKRGDGRWKRVTWHQALDEIGKKMRQSRKRRRDGIMYHVGRPGEAVEPFARATRIDPGHTAAHRDLGRALLESGNASEAARIFAHAIALAEKAGDHQTGRQIHVLLKRAEKHGEAPQKRSANQ